MPDPVERLPRFAPSGGTLPPIDLTSDQDPSAQAAEQQARLVEAIKLRALALAKARGLAGESNASPEGMGMPAMQAIPAMPYTRRDAAGNMIASTHPFPPLEAMPEPPQAQPADPRMARMMAMRSMPRRQSGGRSKEVQAP